MSLVCELAIPYIANSAVDGDEIVRPLRSHATTCLKCQARHAAMSKTARALQSIAGDRTPAPPELEWRVMSALEGDLAIERSLKKPAALVAALASMAAAILIWRFRYNAS